MMIRSVRISVTVLALASATAFAQDTGQKVTFTSPATTAKSLLESLTKATGVTLNTSPQTAGEILLLDVRDVPLAELMKHIARAASAEWKQEGETFRLIRSQAVQNREEQEYIADRAARIRTQQAKMLEELGNQKALTQSEIQKLIQEQQRQSEEITSAVREGRPIQGAIRGGSAGNQNPASRLHTRLLASIHPADLARLSVGTRTVLSTSPTRMQRPLPASANQALADFSREHQAWVAAQPPAPPANPGSEFVLFDASRVTPMNGGLGKVLVILTRSIFSQEIQSELLVADQSGAIVSSHFRAIPIGEALGTRPGSTAADAGAATPQATEKPLEVSAQGREHAQLVGQMPQRGGVSIAAAPALAGAAGGRATFIATSVDVSVAGLPGGGAPPARISASPEWAGRLVQPDKFDPLSFAVSDLYMGLARQRGMQLVASLPDSVLLPLNNRAQQTLTPSQLLEMSRTSLDLEIENSDGWLVVTPKFPAHARAVRVDREELKRLLTGIKSEGRLSLSNLSQYAASRNLPAPGPGLDGRIINALFPSAFNEFNQAQSNWRMLQLYHTLSPVQRRNLADGGVLNLGTLASNQQSIVASLVYDDPSGPMLMEDPATQPGVAQNVVRSEMMIRGEGGHVMRFGSGGGRLMDERTEYLPSGIPSAGTLTAQISTQDAVFATNAAGTADPKFFNAESYGAYVGLVPNIVLAGSSSPPSLPTYDRFRLSQIQSMDFIFRLSQRAQMVRNLRDAWFLSGSSETTYELLPQAFRKQIEESAAQMKGSGAKIQIGGDSKPRPPL